MKKLSFNSNNDKSLNKNIVIYTNKAITQESEDLIGLDIYVDSLKSAIESNVKMIALLGDYGVGKTSVVNLFKGEIEAGGVYDVVTIPMWKINKDVGTLNFHKEFVYQLTQNVKKGYSSYVAKTLNKSFNEISIGLKGKKSKILFAVFLALAFVCFCCSFFAENVIRYYPNVFNISTEKILTLINIAFLAICFIILFFLFVDSNFSLVFKSARNDGERDISIIDIEELLLNVIPKNKKYIVVIEDLDRSENEGAAKEFIASLKSYETISNLSFIISVKRSMFNRNHEDKISSLEEEINKLFDFVLYIPKITIQDYSIILKELLNAKKKDIENLLGLDDNADLSLIHGIQYCLIGNNVNIRLIKERLNRTFNKYASLVNRYKNIRNIDLKIESCVGFAYISTEFPGDFEAGKNEELFDECIKNIINANFDVPLIDGLSPEYASTVFDMIKDDIFDINYRMYIANFPKNSDILTKEEVELKKALIQNYFYYDITEEQLEGKEKIIRESFDLLQNINHSFPIETLSKFNLFKVAMEYKYIDSLLELNKFDLYSEENEKLKYSLKEIDYLILMNKMSSDIFNKFYCKWQQGMHIDHLRELRTELCKKYPNYSHAYSILFTSDIGDITHEELSFLGSKRSKLLILNCSIEGMVDKIKYLLEINAIEDKSDINEYAKMIRSVFETGKYDDTSIVSVINKLMIINGEIISDLLMIEFNIFKNNIDIKSENDISYIEMINKCFNNTNETGEIEEKIFLIGLFNGINESVAVRILNNGNVILYIYVQMANGRYIDYKNSKIYEYIKINYKNLLKSEKMFKDVRTGICKDNASLYQKYNFLFLNEDVIAITQEEFSILKEKYSLNNIIKYTFDIQNIQFSNIKTVASMYDSDSMISSKTFAIIIERISKHDKAIAKEFLKSEKLRVTESKKELKNILELAKKFLNISDISDCILLMKKSNTIFKALEQKLKLDFKNGFVSIDSFMQVYENKETIPVDILNLIAPYIPLEKVYSNLLPSLLKSSMFKEYIIENAINHNCFDYDCFKDNSEYIEASIQLVIRGHKCSEIILGNASFVYECLNSETLEKIPNVSYNYLSNHYQSVIMINALSERDDTFVINYLKNIKGFVSEESAANFIICASNRIAVFTNDLVYKNCHEKLINPGFKSSYTRLVNKNK